MRNQNIAKVLKEYRKRNHLSVNDVSILLEDRSFTAAPKTIYGWESGQANPSADILLTLCDCRSRRVDDDLTDRFCTERTGRLIAAVKFHTDAVGI